jgi:hypothetical protein
MTYIAIFLPLLLCLLGLLVWRLCTPPTGSTGWWLELGKWTYVVCLLACMLSIGQVMTTCSSMSITTSPVHSK